MNEPSPTGGESKGSGRPDDPPLGTYEPVKRAGGPPRPTVSAAPVPFDGTVSYSDGLRLEVTAVTQGRVSGSGPGVLAGEPRSTLDLEVLNGSPRPVSLDGVVVTAVYGPGRSVARPVYDSKTRDFTGRLGAGGSQAARYVFSVPTGELDKVTVYVDVDGRHTVGRFRGSLR